MRVQNMDMSNKTLSILLVLSISLMGVLFLLNLSNGFGAPHSEKFFSLNGVQGVSIDHKGKEYTFNFQQQNTLLRLLNQSVSIPKEEAQTVNKVSLPYGSLTIFRFGKPPIKITPVGFINQQMILDAPELNPSGWIREIGPGDLDPLMRQTYDS